MKLLNTYLFAIGLSLPLFSGVASAGSLLRISCTGQDIGAEVTVNDKFKGECPIEVQVNEGTINVKVLKTVDASHEAAFEQEIRIGDGVVKNVNAVLTPRLISAAGKKQMDDRQRTFRAKLARGEACEACPEMVLIPAGNFQMGSNEDSDEKPIHNVSIKSFALGKTEVTQGLWTAIMGSNPSEFSQCGPNCPVEQVSWDDIQQFLQKLNALSGMRFRLPSEAEWEYAARSGSTGKYSYGDDAGQLGQYAWYSNNSGSQTHRQTHPVAQKQPNAFGLYDMHGNVWERVEDWYHDNYNGAPTDGSAWVSGGEQKFRVFRGGSYFVNPDYLRSAYRAGDTPDFRNHSAGFRLARTLP